MGKELKKAVVISKDLGASSRLLTSAIPKSLLPLGSSTLLEIQLERLAESGFEDVIYFTSYKKNYIERFLGDGSDYGVRLSVRKVANEIASVAILASIADELRNSPFLVMNGDVLTLFDYGKIYDFGCAQDCAIAAAVKRIVASSALTYVALEGENIKTVKTDSEHVSFILAGIYVFKPETIDLFTKSEAPLLEDFMREITEKNQPVRKFEINDYWFDIGEVETFEKAQMDYAYYSKGENKRARTYH